jgi:hypothetical protein
MTADRKAARSLALLWVCLAGLLMVLILVGHHLRPLRSTVDQMPYPPSAAALKALSLGDDQFLFRAELAWLQEVGDGGGRLKPLKEFDYERVADWLRAIDRLDPQSDGVFQLGSTYFGAISDPATAPIQLPPLIDYYAEAAMADPAHRWHWLVWGAIKEQHVVRNRETADRLVDDLLATRASPGTPGWLPLLAAPLLRAVGEKERAVLLDADPDIVERRRLANEVLRERLNSIGSPSH